MAPAVQKWVSVNTFTQFHSKHLESESVSVPFEFNCYDAYHLRPTKLREGNVFSRVCPQWESILVRLEQHPRPQPTWGPYHTGTPCPFQAPPHGEPSPPQTCSNLFNLDLTVQGSEGVKIVHYVNTRTVGKRAVGMGLKCLLVYTERPLLR